MRPLILTDDPPRIRRWCETCRRFTESVMSSWASVELCAEHDEPDEDDLDWIDEDDDEDD